MRWIKLLALFAAFAIAIGLTYFVSRLPESNCKTEPVSSSWADDRTYEATLFRKDCNFGETTFYSVRIDKPGAWFFRIEIEEDPYPTPAAEPVMKWDFHKLQINIPAKQFAGSIERREGDLTVVRSSITPNP